MITHLHGNIPGHVDVTLKLIHPNFRNSEGVSPHMRRQVLGVGFMSTLYVGDAGTGQDLNTAATLPHLDHEHYKHREEGKHVSQFG